MKKHKDAISRTTLRSINKSKYNKVEYMENTYPDFSKIYEFRHDGWRRKQVEK